MNKIHLLTTALALCLNPSIKAETVEMTAALQMFEDPYYGYTPDPQIYQITLKVDGDKVTISNLLNHNNEENSFYGVSSVDVTGTYDAEAHTITIPTLHEAGQEFTYISQDEYGMREALLAGRQDENMEFWSDDAMIINVKGNFEELSTTQHIGVVSVYDGQLDYLTASYPSMTARSTTTSNPIGFLPAELSLGKSFPYNKMTGSIFLINYSGESAAYGVTIPAEAEGMVIDNPVGTIEPMSWATLTLTYTPTKSGDFTFTLSIAYETDTKSGTVTQDVKAEIVPCPDYSAIVKAGQIEFATGNGRPFDMRDVEGSQVAASTAKSYNENSFLEAHVIVPANHSGRLSYKGYAYCTDPDNMYAQFRASVTVDDASEPVFSTTQDAALDGTVELSPGEHTVRFQYSYGSSWNSEVPFYMYLSELSFVTEAAAANSVEVVNPAMDFGNFIFAGSPVSDTRELTLLNRGTEPVKVLSIETGSDNFTAEVPATEAKLMENIAIPVTFKANAGELYETELTIMTSAGQLKATAKANVRQMADFSSIVNDPDKLVTVTTDADYPFEVSSDGSYAYNSTAKADDTEATASSVTFTINVPEGKIARASWEARVSSDEGDRASFHESGDAGINFKFESGENSLSSDDIILDEEKERFLELIPGQTVISFSFEKNGDSKIGGEDMLSISNFSVKLEDVNPTAYTLDRDEVTFGDCIMTETGDNLNKTSALVNIHCMGLGEFRSLTADEIKEDLNVPPFGYRDPGYVIRHGATMEIELIFFPESEGDFDGEAILMTTYGNIPVKCHGRAIKADGLVFTDDFEGSRNWTFVDRDGDSNNWQNSTDIFSYKPMAHCSSGSNALISYSKADTKTENYAVSPEITVPADGGMLSWWVSAENVNAPEEAYALSVIDAADYSESRLGSYANDFTETLSAENPYWKRQTLDLSRWAGKTVRLAFCHLTEGQQSALRLDDVILFSNDKWHSFDSIETITEGVSEVSAEYFNLQGVRVSANTPGLKIRRSNLSNGRSVSTKVITK